MSEEWFVVERVNGKTVFDPPIVLPHGGSVSSYPLGEEPAWTGPVLIQVTRYEEDES